MAGNEALHRMTVCAHHVKFSMQIREHFQKWLSLLKRTALVALRIFAWCHSEKFLTDKIVPMTIKAGILSGGLNTMPVTTVAVETIADMTGLAVLFEEMRILLAEALCDELLLTDSGAHRLVKDRIIVPVAADATFGPGFCRRGLCDLPSLTIMTVRAGQIRMDPGNRNAAAILSKFTVGTPGRANGQQAQGG